MRMGVREDSEGWGGGGVGWGGKVEKKVELLSVSCFCPS